MLQTPSSKNVCGGVPPLQTITHLEFRFLGDKTQFIRIQTPSSKNVCGSVPLQTLSHLDFLETKQNYFMQNTIIIRLQTRSSKNKAISDGCGGAPLTTVPLTHLDF